MCENSIKPSSQYMMQAEPETNLTSACRGAIETFSAFRLGRRVLFRRFIAYYQRSILDWCISPPRNRASITELPFFLEIMILTEEEKERIVTAAQEKMTSDSVVCNTTENASVPPCQSSETQLNKEAMDSPAKRQHKTKVKLAANFSLAPLTKL